MLNKLAQCIAMMNSLNRESVKVLYIGHDIKSLPLNQQNRRHIMYFTFQRNGLVEYFGQDDNFDYGSRRSSITIPELEPTEAVVGTIYKHLKSLCYIQAKEQVIDRLIDHQLKLSGLDFLLQEDACTLH